MAGYVRSHHTGKHAASKGGTEESPFFKWLLITVALLFSLLFLFLPLVNVFVQAFSKGWQAYWTALSEPDAWSAIRLTLWVAAITVPLNVIFGLAF
jgi:sulfate transport system permease protein